MRKFTLLLALLVGVATATGYAKSIFVDWAIAQDGSGSTWADARKTLQSALTVAVAGDEIWLKSGVYIPGALRSDSFVIPDGVAIYGGFAGTESTKTARIAGQFSTLSGDVGVAGDASDNAFRVVRCGVGGTFDSLVISGGNGSGVSEFGAGVVCQAGTVVFENCRFEANATHRYGSGGAIYSRGASVVVRNCRFTGNQAYWGGAIFLGEGMALLAEKCEFQGNAADFGGAIEVLGGTADISDSYFRNNAGEGGGVHSRGSAGVKIERCFFLGNDASRWAGAAVSSTRSIDRIDNTVFAENISVATGGTTLTSFGSKQTIRNITSVGGVGSLGLSEPVDTVLQNSIVWSRGADGDKLLLLSGGGFRLSRVVLRGGAAGLNSIDGSRHTLADVWANDPKFADIGSPLGPDLLPRTNDDGLRLTYGSLATDRGISDAGIVEDALGKPRPMMAGVDLGAYELDPGLTDTDGDGLSDYLEEFAYGTDPKKADTDGDGMPDGWEIAHGLDPRRNDAKEDKDFDFLTNLEEFQGGTKPNNWDSDSNGVPDFLQTRSKTAWAADYDRNDRLIGVRYEQQSFGFRYDGNGNLVGQSRLGRDGDADGLPDYWEFANGLNPFSAVGNDGASGDPDGDGWTNLQEWTARTNPRDAFSRPGANGATIATFEVPFTPTRFVSATGQLDGTGGDELVVGADGDPGGQNNFVRIYAETGGWTYEQVSIGNYGVTSAAIGQVTGRGRNIYLGLRKPGGQGRVMELTRTETGWQSAVVAESTSDTAYVQGVRQLVNSTDLLVSLTNAQSAVATTYRCTRQGDQWRLVSLIDLPPAVPVGAIATFAGESSAAFVSRAPNGLRISFSGSDLFDDFDDGTLATALWTQGGSGDADSTGVAREASGTGIVEVAWNNGASSYFLEGRGLWAGGQRAVTISIKEISRTQNVLASGGGTWTARAVVLVGGAEVFSADALPSSGDAANRTQTISPTIQLVRGATKIFSRWRDQQGSWSAWSASAYADSIRFVVSGNRSGGTVGSGSSAIKVDRISYDSVGALLDLGASPADFVDPEGVYRVATGKWYFKTPAAMSWSAAQNYANGIGCDLVTLSDSASNAWLQTWASGDIWLGYLRDEPNAAWRWLSGASPIYTNWAAGNPGTGGNRFAFYNAGVWTSATGSELKLGVVETRSQTSGVATSIVVQPSATRLPWLGRSLQAGLFFSDGTAQSSIIDALVDDRDGSGTLTVGDEFSVSESVLAPSGAFTRTLARRVLTPSSPVVGYALTAVRMPGSSADTLVTAEPDGQLAAWLAAPLGTEMRRKVLSVQRLGHTWHALERLALIGQGEGVVGLFVNNAAPRQAAIVLVGPAELGAEIVIPLAQTPPSARVMASPSAGGAVARLDVRVWDSESNPVRLFVQYQSIANGPWLDATLSTVNNLPALSATALATAPGGAVHQVTWNAGANLGSTFRGNVSLRVRAADADAVGAWSDAVIYSIDGAGDTDGDGIPDAYEDANGLNKNVNDANLDLDGDGISNLDEYLQGTKPNDATSAKYSLTVAGVGATVTKNPDQVLYDKGTTVNVTATQQPATLSFIGWAPTTPLAGGGYAAAVTTNPLQVVMTSHKLLTAYAGLPLADALDTPALTWTTGGHALWYGESSTTQDGLDAAQATGLAANGNEAWMEATVTAPGSISWRAKLDVAAGGGSALQVLVGDVLQDTLSTTTDWTQKIIAVNGAGATKVRWRFVRQSANAAAVNDSAFIDTVAYVAAAKPVITTQPQNLAVGVGGNAGFSVIATSETPLSYQWQRKTAAQTDFTDLVAGDAYSAVKQATLAITGVIEPMQGDQFRCLVTNVSGTTTSSAATLAVIVPPTITAQPQPFSVQVGGEVNFSVTASGTAPFEYQWRRNGSAITGATASVLTLTNVQLTAAAEYSVQVSNGAGSVQSTVAGLSVLTNSVAPALTSHPASVTLTIGQTATFTVTVSGLPTPTIQWKKNGAEISGATTSSLSLTNAQFADAGTFVAVVRNVAGSVTSNPATLTVLPLPTAPRITTQPASQSVILGTSANFAVVAEGFPVPAFQWRKNGADIVGATTSTLIVATPNVGAAAIYSVRVANSQGFVDSDPAELKLLATPVITLQPVGQSVSEGANVNFRVEATAIPPPAYQWRRNGVNLVGATHALLVINGATTAQAGLYSVVVTNTAGTVFSESAALNVIPAGTTASHTVVGPGYVAGKTVTISNTITFPVTTGSVGWQVLIPTGWTFAGSSVATSADAPNASPAANATGLLEWVWMTVPGSPLTFAYTLNVPANAAGNYALAAIAEVREAGQPAKLMARPDPLPITAAPPYHSADTDRDWKIGLFELTRVISLYNTRIGTTRTGRYKVEVGSEDGFASDGFTSGAATVTLAYYHSADSDRDGTISLIEISRIIELYNYRVGTSRTGNYHVQAGSEDGFNPGP